MFLIFVCIAAIFWFFMALDDEMQQGEEVRLVIDNVPDSVTFINLPPEKVRLTVRDKGSNLLKAKVSGQSDLHLNFEEFAVDGIFRVSSSRLHAAVRHLFGSQASITSVSPDSLVLRYSDTPGRRVPVNVVYDVTTVPGMVLEGKPEVSSPTVLLVGGANIDTVYRINTAKITLRKLDKSKTVNVELEQIPGARVMPSAVKVTFNVEQLVRKESEVSVTADNIPLGQDILFFPSRVKVAYYVPMSKYNTETSGDIRVVASFNEAQASSTDKVSVHVVSQAPFMKNMELLTDSVEYTMVRGR